MRKLSFAEIVAIDDAITDYENRMLEFDDAACIIMAITRMNVFQAIDMLEAVID